MIYLKNARSALVFIIFTSLQLICFSDHAMIGATRAESEFFYYKQNLKLEKMGVGSRFEPIFRDDSSVNGNFAISLDNGDNKTWYSFTISGTEKKGEVIRVTTKEGFNFFFLLNISRDMLLYPQVDNVERDAKRPQKIDSLESAFIASQFEINDMIKKLLLDSKNGEKGAQEILQKLEKVYPHPLLSNFSKLKWPTRAYVDHRTLKQKLIDWIDSFR